MICFDINQHRVEKHNLGHYESLEITDIELNVLIDINNSKKRAFILQIKKTS